MNAAEFLKIASRILPHPTAPYFEEAVCAEAEKICAEIGLDCARDGFGNLHVRVVTNPRLRPLVLAAHMDHPGFEVIRQVSAREWLVLFRGGVADRYFKKGLRLQLMPGRIRAVLGERKQKSKQPVFLAHAKQDADEPLRFGVWDLTDLVHKQNRIFARACDDLIGVSAVLGTCIEVQRSRKPVHVIGILSRAEEVGFHGALALARASANQVARPKKKSPKNRATRTVLPRNSLVVSLETSRELPGAKMSAGVIIRVGDKASIFHSEGTRFLTEVASELKDRDGSFDFQRALMSGGTCEATAYQEFGFDAAAVCIALGNYHNCGKDFTIRPEYVSVQDACGMVGLLKEAALRMKDYPALIGKLKQRLERLTCEALEGLTEER